MKSPAFGLIAQLAKTRITLPLIHVETRFRVTGDVVLVEMDQVFEQNAREPLDVTYTFPLPGGAAVHRCEMIINDRVIRAVVMEEAEARRTVAEKKAAGHRTALVELDRDNLFTLQLGNTAPGDRIVIRFAYFEVLDRLGAGLSLRIPFCPGIRYIPGKPLLRKNRGLGYSDDTDQVPDASRITPPRIGSDHPDAATIFLHGTLDAEEVDLTTCSSPSHPAVIRAPGDTLEVELAGEQHVPDRDFILRWQETAVTAAAPRAWTTQHDGHLYALLQLRAPRVEAAQAAGDDFAQDIYFLLDRSGSMSGGNWEKAAQALHAFVRELGAHDRVWITCFESEYQDFSDSLMSRDELLADESFIRLADIGVGGGTELLPALRHVLDVRTAQPSDRPERLVLITDGQVGNETEILKLARGDTMAGVPVHTFGIDRAVNDAFLKNLARLTGGRCALMTPDDDIPAAVKNLAVTLRRPVLTGLRLETPAETAGLDAALPDLNAGEVLRLPLRLTDGQTTVSLTARSAAMDAVWRQEFHLEPGKHEDAARLLWARERCTALIDAQRKSDAIGLAIAHNLVCAGASFVAWDDAEKVPVARREVYQPSMVAEACPSAPPPPMALAASNKRLGTVLPAARGQRRSRAEESSLESSVGDYFAPSSLSLGGDDEWLGEMEPPGNLCRETASGAPVPPPLPQAVDDLLKRLSVRYSSWSFFAVNDEAPGTEWSKSLVQTLTTRGGLPDAVAEMLARILRQWAMQVISGKRQLRLEAIVKTVESAADPSSALREVLTTLPPSDAVRDAVDLLDTGCAHFPAKQKARP